MIWTTARAAWGTFLLIAASAGELVYLIITPTDPAATVADNVAAVAAHPSAMGIVVWIDLLIALAAPAVIVVGAVVGFGRSRLATTGTLVVAFASLYAMYLLAADVLLKAAADHPTDATSLALVDAFNTSPVISTVIAAYLLGTVVGYVLVGIAAIRSASVPRWVGIALIAFPVLNLGGGAAGVSALSIGGAAVWLVAYLGVARLAFRLARTGAPVFPARAAAMAAA